MTGGDRDLRLVDLHVDWPLQYAPETTVYDADLYPSLPGRLDQADGYLQTVAAAILACYRSAEDWARRADPWAALGALLARIEAEFPGRLLIGPDDWARWRAEAGGLAWGVIGVEGFDALIRSPADLDRLPALFARGVRLFQPVYAPTSLLGGSSADGDDRGLSDLGRAFLQTLFSLAPEGDGPRPIFDLAHLNPRAAAEALDWFEADPARPDRVPPVYSHGAIRREGYDRPRALAPESLARLRALGGVVGLTPAFYDSAEALRVGIEAAAARPFLGREGYEGIAIGTDFLGVDANPPGLNDAPGVVAWLRGTFDPPAASALIAGNARRLLARAVGETP